MVFSFLRKLWSPNSHDCLICAIKPAIYFSLGMIYIVLPECPHTNSTLNSNFKKSGLARKINFFYLSILLIGMSTSTMQLIKKPSILNVLKQGIVLSKLLNSVCFTLFIRIKQSVMIKHTLQLCKLLETRRNFGIDTILSAENSKYHQRNSLFIAIGTLVLVLLYFIPRLWDCNVLSDGIILLTMSINYVALACLGLYVNGIVDVYKYIFINFFKFVELTMNEKKSDFLAELNYLIKYYLKMADVYKNHVMSIGNVLFYVELFLCVCIVSVFTYLYYNFCIEYGVYFDYVLVWDLLVIQLFSMKFVMTAGSITYLGNDLLSFLYKYPISQLSRSEANQVEMLILTVTLEKPIITASDVFIVGTNLLTSITGNVITYVLVALQFNAVFSN